MRKPKYATAPVPSPRMPRGIPYIVGNEAAERFSFYGMKAILFVFMTEHLLDRAGSPDLMQPEKATVWVHTFASAVYFFPFFGAILADAFWGKYHTIIRLSLLYCLGHLALALDATRLGLFVGLTLIALGAGGIKSCVSAHVGDQFGTTNAHLMSRVFGWFYLAINEGASTSMLLTPKLLEWFGPHVAFAVPGVLMALATAVFWMGRYRFVHLILVPLFGYVIYPAIERRVRFSPLWRICTGLFLTAAAAAAPAVIQTWIDAGARPSIGWQVVGYVVLTTAEVLVSITCLEFSYTQAPKKAKSLVMGVFWLSVSMGNAFTALVNYALQLTRRPDGTVWLEGADYFWFFAALTLLAALGFVVVAALYRERTYIQDEQ